MPDPKVSLPVRVEKRGDSFLVVDADGKRMPGSRAWTNEASARAEAAQVNVAWKRAKSERKAKGAPEITEADVRFERLHPRGPGGEWIKKFARLGTIDAAPPKRSLYTMKRARGRLQKKMESGSEKEQASVRMQLRELDRRIGAKEKVRATSLRPAMASPATGKKSSGTGQPSKLAMYDELVTRASQMSDTEFSVKRNRYVQAGGWWPNSLSDWDTSQGRKLSDEILRAKGKRSPVTGGGPESEEAFQKMKATAAALGMPWDDAEMRKQMGLPQLQPLAPDIAAEQIPKPGEKPKLNEEIAPQGIAPQGTVAGLGVEKGKYTPDVTVQTTPSHHIGSVYGKNVVVTGKLTTGTRNEIHGKISNSGGIPQSSISAKTDLLVVGDKPGSKLAKAKAMGIPIVTEHQLQDLLEAQRARDGQRLESVTVRLQEARTRRDGAAVARLSARERRLRQRVK